MSGTRMYVKPGGNIRIGTQNVPFKFVVDKGQTIGDGIAINGINDTHLRLGVGQPTVWSWTNGWAVPGDLSLIEEQVSGSRIYVKPGGNVGINTSNPTATLEVNGTVNFDQPVTFAPRQMLPSVSGDERMCPGRSSQSGDEVFFHRTSLTQGNFDNLEEGHEVEFDVERGDKGTRTSNVQVTGIAI